MKAVPREQRTAGKGSLCAPSLVTIRRAMSRRDDPDGEAEKLDQLTYTAAILLGLVQGATEFLPVSSSGHLSLLQAFFGAADSGGILFDVLLHLGTLTAVAAAYRRDILAMARELGPGLRDLVSRRRPGPMPPARRLMLLVVSGTVPLALVLPVRDDLERFYGNTLFIGCALLVTGLLLFVADRMGRGEKTETSATVADVLLVGLAQAVATVPGLSRSGTTVSMGLARGFRRSFALRYSFLLSIPAVLGANLISLRDALGTGGAPVTVYLAGMAAAAAAGYGSIRLLRRMAERGRFGPFAWYCWIIGFIAIAATLSAG